MLSTSEPLAQPNELGETSTERATFLQQAMALCNAGKLHEALTFTAEALEARPDSAALWNAHGVFQRTLGHFHDAVESYRQALDFAPNHAGAWSNLGNVFKDLKKVESAIRCHRRAIELDPSDPTCRHNLGIALASANQHREAIDCYNIALLLKPNDPKIRWDRALAHLHIGAFGYGWLDYEARFETGAVPKRSLPGKPWRLEPFRGQRLYVAAEQGFGDSIWASRYLRRVKELGGKIILECRPDLVPLFQPLGLIDEFVIKGTKPSKAQWHCYICSLAGLFTPGWSAIPNAPYLIAPPDRVAKFSETIAASGKRLKVGIVWSGSTTFKLNPDRAAPLERFVQYFSIPGVQLFSLQKGPPTSELRAMTKAPIVDLAPLIEDFADTAAAVSQLDLVIMTDSSVAHLAGALGKPVWILLGFNAYWMWHAEPETTPWYPSARLFRPPVWHGWDAVFDAAAAELWKLVLARDPAAMRHLSQSTQEFEATKDANRSLALAAEHLLAGRLDDAEKFCRGALDRDPQNAKGLHRLGLVALRRGHAKEAGNLIRRALRINPDDSEAFANLATALKRQGRLKEAVAAYRKAIEIGPAQAAMYYNLANTLREQRFFAKAVDAYREAIRLSPSDHAAHAALGIALYELGQLLDAVSTYEVALELRPNSPEILCNLGTALSALYQHEQAVAVFERAIALKPDYAAAYCNLGNTLLDAGKRNQAVPHFQQALFLNPDFVEALIGLGTALHEQGELDAAIPLYQRALELRPDSHKALNQLIFVLSAMPGVKPKALRDAVIAGTARWNIRSKEVSFHNSRDPERRLRIGYVSPDFRQNPVGYFLTAVLEQHDSENFQAVCYNNSRIHDDMTDRIRAAVPVWRNIAGVDDEMAAKIIAKDEIDILVDLTGHMGLHRLSLFARRAAPVQTTWLGFFCTTGLSAMDYLIADPIVVPTDDEKFYTEEISRLPNCYLCLESLFVGLPEPTPEKQVSDSILFASFNRRDKINPPTLALWAEILKRTPGSRLLIKTNGLNDASAVAELQSHFEGGRISPDRLIFEDHTARAEHLAGFGRIDIVLDTFPYGGATTTAEALGMGLPVVTRSGETFVSRVGASMLNTIGHPELIAHSAEEYVEIAVALAGDPARISAVRANLLEYRRQAPSHIARFTRDLESVFRSQWQSYCQRSAG